MQRGFLVRGRLRGKHIELVEDVTLPEAGGEARADVLVDVFICAARTAQAPSAQLLDLVANMPAGSCSKTELDLQLVTLRDEWSRSG
jgi:hypothetical protein